MMRWKMTKRKDYTIDTNKIKTIQDVKNIFDCLGIICDMSILDKSDPRYELAKEYFVVPHNENPRKSLEEIEQELNKKFDELLVKTKKKFDMSRYSAEYRYNQFCKQQEDDFEYAKEHGSFRKKIRVNYSVFKGSEININNAICNSNFVINSVSNSAGYYTVGTIRYYMDKKPNRIVRYFSKLLLNLEWKDK